MPAEGFPLAILAKAPLAGRVKTRLIPALGAERAARLHAELLTDTLDIACRATASANITLWTALDHRHPLFLELASRFGFGVRACALSRRATWASACSRRSMPCPCGDY